MIRAIAEGRQPLPEDPIARAAVERLARRYKVRKTRVRLGTALLWTKGRSSRRSRWIKSFRVNRFACCARARRSRSESCSRRMPEDKLDDVVIAMPQPMRNQLMAAAPAALRRKMMLLNAPQQVIAFDLARRQAVSRDLQQPPAGRAAGGFLVQPLQRFSRQGRGPFPGADLRARGDPAACAGAVPRSAGSHRQEPRDAVLSGQLAERRAGGRFAAPMGNASDSAD